MRPVLAYYQEGWKVLTRHPSIIGVSTVYILASLVLSYLAELPDVAFIRFVLVVISYLAQLALSLGLIRAILKGVDDIPPRILDLLEGYLYFLPGLVAYVLLGFSILAGLLLLILPGIYVAVRLQFVFYLVVEGREALRALRESWAITRGLFWRLLGFGMVGLLINLLGILAFLVGVVITFPWVFTAQAILFRDLLSQEQDDGES